MMEDVKPTIDICRAMQEKMDAEAKLKALVTNQAAKVKNFQDKPSKGYPSRKRSPSPQSSTSWRMMSSPQPTEALPPAPALPGSSTTRLGGSSVRGREEKAHRSCHVNNRKKTQDAERSSFNLKMNKDVFQQVTPRVGKRVMQLGALMMASTMTMNLLVGLPLDGSDGWLVGDCMFSS